MTNATITHPATLQPADDSRCLLVRSVLHDAMYLHFEAIGGCPACARTNGGECPACWDTHRAPIQRYGALILSLDEFVCEGHPEDLAYPLTGQDRQAIAAALPEAITYRQAHDSIEDLALLAAYQELATRITR